MRAYNVLTLLLATLATFCWWRAGTALGLAQASPEQVRASFRIWSGVYTGLVWLGFGLGLWVLSDTLYLRRARGTDDPRARAWLLVSPFLLWILGVVGAALLADAWNRYRGLHGLAPDARRTDPALLLVVTVPVAVALAALNAGVVRWLRRKSDQQARIENMNQRARR